MLINFSRLKSALLIGLGGATFCVGTLVLQTAMSNHAVGQDALNTLDGMDKPAEPAALSTAQDPQAQDPQAQKQQEGRQKQLKQLSDALFKELENLVPGDQVEGSPAADSLLTAVDAIVLQRNSKMALTILEQAAERHPEFPPAELLMAGLSFAAKDQNNGLQYMQKAAIKNPSHPGVYAAYGRLASGGNRNVDAMVHFDKLLTLLDQIKDPTSLAHYENEYLEGMSQIAVRLKKFDLARNLSGQMLKRDPDNTNPLQLLARVAFDEGNLNEAVENLAKLREKKPDTRVPEAVIGTWFARAGNQARANDWLGKLPTAYPNDARVQFEYAAWALRQEDIESAAAAIAKAEAAEPAIAGIDTLKGKIAFYQGRYDEAVALFKKLHETNPNNAEISNMYVLSMIESSSLDNHAIANELANKNLRANPNNRVTLATLGYVRLRKVGVNDQLKSLFTKVAQTRDGQTPEVDYFLANFLKEIGNNKSALDVLQQASNYPGLFLYRQQANQMKQALAATAVLPTMP